MNPNRWMIFGAYGYTGMLITKTAVRRDHKPLLAGRNKEKLAAVAADLGLDSVVIDLPEKDRLINSLVDVDLVINAAGPFNHTALPLTRACLETGTSYLDVSGEAMILEKIFTLDQQAREKQIAIIPGVGFNVLASDCLALYVSKKIDEPLYLEIATQWITDRVSPGSSKTMIEGYSVGIMARREGQLVRIKAREGRRQIRFQDGESAIVPATLGDLATAYRTTGIPNITTYTAVPERTANFYRWAEPILRRLYTSSSIRRLASNRVEQSASPYADYERGTEPSQVWVAVRNEKGSEKQAWLKTVDSYQFTAEVAVRSVEKISFDHQVGVLTPATAFGADFVMEIPGSKRSDSLA